MSVFVAGGRRFDLDNRCLVMGILNLTPDSFSDGGSWATYDAAVSRAEALLAEGADIIDIGGESNRPGARRIDEAEELDRVLPVLRHLGACYNIPLSIDTVKYSVARAALDAGAAIINDVSGLRRDPALADLAAEYDAALIIMHSSAEPEVMQQHTDYADVVNDVATFLERQAAFAESRGVRREGVVIDPGLGFGKTVGQNLSIVKHLDRFCASGYPVLLGHSRKSFIGATLDLPVDQRLEGGLAVQSVALLAGVRLLRVHDVAAAARAARMVEAILAAP